MINKDILSGAPDGATHCDYGGDYVRYESNSDEWEFHDKDTNAWIPTRAIDDDIRSLADIKRIVGLKRVLNDLMVSSLRCQGWEIFPDGYLDEARALLRIIE